MRCLGRLDITIGRVKTICNEIYIDLALCLLVRKCEGLCKKVK